MRTRLQPEKPIRDKDKQYELIKKAQSGDDQARERLIRSNLGLVYKIGSRFTGRGYDKEEIFQVGCMGLIKAVDNFDLERGLRFSTYAVPTIIGEIKRFLRDDEALKVSRRLKRKRAAILHKREELAKRLRREPQISELAEALGLDVEEIVFALESQHTPMSLEQQLYNDHDSQVTLHEQIAAQQEDLDTRLDLKEQLFALEPRERKIIEMRYFADKTQAEVGAALGLSQVQISRLEKRILEQMRKRLDSDSAPD